MSAMSSGLTMRPSAVLARYWARMSAKGTPTSSARAWITWSMRGPSTMPGRIALTRMPKRPSSIERLSVMPTIAHLVAA